MVDLGAHPLERRRSADPSTISQTGRGVAGRRSENKRKIPGDGQRKFVDVPVDGCASASGAPKSVK